MTRSAHFDGPDDDVITRIRRRIPPHAKPALRRAWALIAPIRRLPRQMCSLGRDAPAHFATSGHWLLARVGGLIAQTRLGQWARVIHRVRTAYRRVAGRPPSLLRPRRFTEKIQWRKLFELDPMFAVLTDKLAARDFVAGRIGPGRQAELLWVGSDPDAIPFDRLVPPYVVKSTHAQGHTIIVRDKAALDAAAVRAAARGWLAHCHGTPLNEPAYIHLPRRLMVERLLVNADGTAPIERCAFVFDGHATVIQTSAVASDGIFRTLAFHTRAWERLPFRLTSIPDVVPPPRPPRLTDILDLAERLGAGLSHCRVDIHDCGDRLVVGEITLCSWSGLLPFHDPAHDFALGAHWTIRRPMLRAVRAVALRRWEIRSPRG